MTLTELKYIVAVARERHFGKAAEACFVSQPTLSVAIKKLEEELESWLFERNASEVAVTPLGEEIVRQAQVVLEQAAAIKEIAKRGKDPLAGPLRLGVIYTIGPYLLPDLVRQVIERTPQMPLMLQENLTAKLLEQLRLGEIDCAIPWPSPFPTPIWRSRRSTTSPSSPWCRSTIRWRSRTASRPASSSGRPCCCWAPATASATMCSRSAPEFARFSNDAEGIRKSFEGSSLETIRHMVAARHGHHAGAAPGVPNRRSGLARLPPGIRSGRRLLSALPALSRASHRCAASCHSGGAASRATRRSPRCAMPSTPANCRASNDSPA